MKQFIEVVGNIDCRSVRHEHGEKYIDNCFENGNRPATVRKKVGTLKHLFQLAVQRRQIDENPLRYVSQPKVPRRAIRVYSNDECSRMIQAARESGIGNGFKWDLLILTALCTGMRRGELLNLTWKEIDFAKQVINISPKENSDETWEWQIKDSDRRSVPITDEVIKLLVEHQVEQTEGYPYVFVPPSRFDHIQSARKGAKLPIRQANCPVGNFLRQFQLILIRSEVPRGQFHDLRRTSITNWFANGLSEFEVMILAGHASFDTTRKFYMAIRNDLTDRARIASQAALKEIAVAKPLQVSPGAQNEKGSQL